MPVLDADSTDLTGLAAEVRALARAVDAGGAALYAEWLPHLGREAFRPGARNLADYLAIRHHDLTALQSRLVALGLSSLGRAEAHIRPSLQALEATLARLVGQPATWPRPEAFREGPDRIGAAQEAFFGPHPVSHATRIMVTLPSEAADEPGLVAQLLDAGANCLRINCAHDGPEVWARMLAHIRAADARRGYPCPVLMDLGGPKIRVTEVFEARRHLLRGDRFRIVLGAGDLDGETPALTISEPGLIARLRPGNTVLIDDGKIAAAVVARDGHGVLLEVRTARAKGVKLKVEKGVNLPGQELDLPPLTAKDLQDLDFVARHADIVGYSFVQRPEDVALLANELARRRGAALPQPLMLKIETPLAVKNLPRLLIAAGGRAPVAVMIARGDLALEVGAERLSELQEEILWLCEAAQVPVVWATQVLETLVKEGAPSRAEVTDAAMGQRAECVMLNKGPFIAEGVAFLAAVLHRMDRHQSKKSARLSALTSWQGDLGL